MAKPIAMLSGTEVHNTVSADPSHCVWLAWIMTTTPNQTKFTEKIPVLMVQLRLQ